MDPLPIHREIVWRRGEDVVIEREYRMLLDQTRPRFASVCKVAGRVIAFDITADSIEEAFKRLYAARDVAVNEERTALRKQGVRY